MEDVDIDDIDVDNDEDNEGRSMFKQEVNEDGRSYLERVRKISGKLIRNSVAYRRARHIIENFDGDRYQILTNEAQAEAWDKAQAVGERLYEIEENKNNAWERLKRRFPNMKKANPNFTYRINEFDMVEVKVLRQVNAKWHPIGKVDKSGFPKSIKDFLGDPIEVVMDGLDEEVNVINREKAPRIKKIAEIDAKIKNITSRLQERISDRRRSEDVERDELVNERDEQQEEINELEKRKEEIEERIEELEKNMTIRERVKRIFKKYGFTAAAVLSSIGVVIGVIVSNLKSGLGKIAKGMGNGLKALGKKLAQILPGMVGAIASFIFKTAGEVVGFLGKHAWLLIVGVLLFLIEQIKKKRK